MVTHFKISGHLACGREGKKLQATTDSGRVTCRNCRHTEAFATERGSMEGTSPADAPLTGEWRNNWRNKLAGMPGQNRLPRGFPGQFFV